MNFVIIWTSSANTASLGRPDSVALTFVNSARRPAAVVAKARMP